MAKVASGKRIALLISGVGTIGHPNTKIVNLDLNHTHYTKINLKCTSHHLPRPGLKLVSPALAGRFLTTVPPGKPSHFFLYL